jgi:hypothetical protein
MGRIRHQSSALSPRPQVDQKSGCDAARCGSPLVPNKRFGTTSFEATNRIITRRQKHIFSGESVRDPGISPEDFVKDSARQAYLFHFSGHHAFVLFAKRDNVCGRNA